MVKLIADKRIMIASGLAAGVALAWIAARGVKGAAESTARAAVGIAEGTATGVVVGIGQAVGVPETDRDQCAADLAAGRTWDASFSCPAGTWLKSIF